MLAYNKGDTIIEVLLAFTVFSLVSVGTMTVMNAGVNTSQRALEITQVRQHIQSQAESLRAAQQAYAASENPATTQWHKLAKPSTTENSSRFTDVSSCPAPVWVNSARVFIMDSRTAKFTDTAVDSNWYQDINSAAAPAVAQVQPSGSSVRSYGIWIERVYETSGSAATPNAYSFIVRACWFSPGVSVPLQIETVVRLYEPNS